MNREETISRTMKMFLRLGRFQLTESNQYLVDLNQSIILDPRTEDYIQLRVSDVIIPPFSYDTWVGGVMFYYRYTGIPAEIPITVPAGYYATVNDLATAIHTAMSAYPWVNITSAGGLIKFKDLTGVSQYILPVDLLSADLLGLDIIKNYFVAGEVISNHAVDLHIPLALYIYANLSTTERNTDNIADPTKVQPSKILAKIQVPDPDITTFFYDNQSIYHLPIKSQTLSQLEILLTDSDGRKIQTSRTWSMVLTIDFIKKPDTTEAFKIKLLQDILEYQKLTYLANPPKKIAQ